MITWINLILAGLIALCLSVILFLRNHIADLGDVINDLKIEAREKRAWEGRYNALLEQAEASRQRLIYDGEASRGKPSGTVALDVNGYPWLCYEGGWWKLVKDVLQGKRSELSPIVGPYTIVYVPEYTPKEES